MKKQYKHIFFDLDHTLWDYDTNAEQTLRELYDSFDLASHGVSSPEHFLTTYFRVNAGLWQQLDTGEINKFYLRNNRFRLVLEAAGAIMKTLSPETLADFNHQFLNECPKKTALIEGTIDVLDVLKGKFDMHIITNGFEEVQSIKMEHSGLLKYFDKIITSEKAGHKKPNAGIFTYALKHGKATLEDSIMIGDNRMTDIKGARDFGMDQVYFNPNKDEHTDKVTHEIVKLEELKEILL